ncbi:MAG TPA: GDP-mannose 4,6-dehydratase [Candidatus Tectomicrobia bacterium]
MRRRVLITGITGQDGSYLTEHLLRLGYEVHGMVPLDEHQCPNLVQVQDQVTLHSGTLLDMESIHHTILASMPHEIYHLGALTFVPEGWKRPLDMFDCVAGGTLRLLESLRLLAPTCRVFIASTSEMFGNAPTCPQCETTPFSPVSPYGAAKLYAHNLAVSYRRSYGMFIACGIMFNHESPRRAARFVSQKVCEGAVAIKFGLARELVLGNLDAIRDWGHAADYVHAMHLMLQAAEPSDYVIATGVGHSVLELCAFAFQCLGLDWKPYVRVDQSLYRPVDIGCLIGDATKARRELGWKPTYGFREMISELLEAALCRVDGQTQARRCAAG